MARKPRNKTDKILGVQYKRLSDFLILIGLHSGDQSDKKPTIILGRLRYWLLPESGVQFYPEIIAAPGSVSIIIPLMGQQKQPFYFIIIIIDLTMPANFLLFSGPWQLKRFSGTFGYPGD